MAIVVDPATNETSSIVMSYKAWRRIYLHMAVNILCFVNRDLRCYRCDAPAKALTTFFGGPLHQASIR